MIPRCKVGSGVTGAVRYALSEGKDDKGQYRTEPKGEQSRVAWMSGTGLGFEIHTAADADLARRVMEFDALNQTSRTKLCVKDCVHLSLGWRPGEEPTRAEMEAAAHQALAALGMANAKAIFVAHTDEPYAHLHIVASKINPATGHAYDMKGDFLKLSTWAEAYEREFSGGLICTRRQENNQVREAIDRRDAGALLDLMTQQRATFKGRDLERILAKQITSEFTRAQFAEKVLSHPQTVKLADEAAGRPTRYTTRAVLEAEGQVLRAAAALARAAGHDIGPAVRAATLRRQEFTTLSGEQLAAVHHATGATGVALIDGQAGTGKSFTIDAIRQAYTAAGCHVIGLAPTHAVAEDMRAGGFPYSATAHSELFRLNSHRTRWDERTVIILDEAAMIDTKLMAQITAHAEAARAKLIMVGDDRQLSSIDRGGMFGVLKDIHGAAELAEVRRQSKNDDKRAAELMADGNFHTALAMYDTKGAIHWTRDQDAARAALVEQWAKDSAADPGKSRFVFAYTNADVDRLNADIRAVRKERGELGPEEHSFQTRHGPALFSERDRIQITGTDKEKGLINGAAGTIDRIEGSKIALRLDGREGKTIEFDAKAFQEFRHGYAGTIYKGQGRTLDQTYLYHSEHWRSAASYVALTRHRDKAELFVGRDTAQDVKTLARQMARVDDRRAASHFHQLGAPVPVRPMTLQELAQPDIQAKQQGEPSPPRPLDWAQSPGMVAQQKSALKAAQRAAPAPPHTRAPILPAKTAAPAALPQAPTNQPAMRAEARPALNSPATPAARAPAEAKAATPAPPAPAVPPQRQTAAPAQPWQPPAWQPVWQPAWPQPNRVEVTPQPPANTAAPAALPQAPTNQPAMRADARPALNAPAPPAARAPVEAKTATPAPIATPASAARSVPAAPAQAPINRPLTANEISAMHSSPVLRARYHQDEQQRKEQEKKTAATAPGKPAVGGNVPSEKQVELMDSVEKRFQEITSRFTRGNREDARERDNERGNEHGGGRGGRGRTRR